MEGAGNWSTREMTLREAVMGSSFTATGREDAMGGSLSFWGRGGQSSFDGREGTFTLDGDASTAMLWARTESDRTAELASSDSDVTRLRLGLEGSWKVSLSGGGHVTPKLELGLRHDGGDAETGSGIELGGGVSWSSPATGIRLDLSGRTLVSHDDDDLEDRGFSADLTFDPDGNTGRGPSFSLRQERGGRSAGGLDALFAAGPLSDRAGSGDGESHWTMEGAWGFPAFSGRYTGSPHAGMGIAGDVRDYSVGWRLTPEAGSAADLSFGVRATRRESTGTVPEHVFGFEAGLRW